MKDRYGREITYLRLSVTDLCDLRCLYCMPEQGVPKKRHEDMLTEDEMIAAVEAAASLGIRKVRITGGEPLVKRNILSICRRTAAVPGIQEIGLTTNGTRLRELAVPLREAGVQHLNMSLDTLDPEKYAHITRCGRLQDALDGLHAALDAGFETIKLNTVLIGGFNDSEIQALAALTLDYAVDVRFIELMPMAGMKAFPPSAFISADAVLEALSGAGSETKARPGAGFEEQARPSAGLEEKARPGAGFEEQARPGAGLEELPSDGGVAKRYRLPGAKGSIGLIRPRSEQFCGECNRIRLTADGMLKPCLHSNAEYSLKGLPPEEMRERIREAILAKPAWHGGLAACSADARIGRGMNAIGG